jgi:hypothetical protein
MTQIREFLIALKVLNNEVRRVIVSTQCILMKKKYFTAVLQIFCKIAKKRGRKEFTGKLPIN